MLACSLRNFSACCIALSGAVVFLFPTSVEAQYVSRSAGGGLHVSAPGVSVNVPPINTIAARAPGGGRRFFGRRRALNEQQQRQQQQQQARANRQANGQTPAQGGPQGQMVPDLAQPLVAVTSVPAVVAPSAPTNDDAEKAKTLPTPEKLAKMDVSQLEATLQDVSGQLHERLSKLKTGASWQRYLKISGELLHAPIQNNEALQKTLAKYDAVAGNPRYAKLAGLPSFIATGATLRELASNSGGPQLNGLAAVTDVVAERRTVVAEEVLPTPAEPQQPDATRGERSILKRASR